VEKHEREERADACGGQRGKNGDRVDIALVENAEHDVDDDDGARMRNGSLASEVRNSAALPE
jgi:hypothetical protein